ncbi:MAG: PKD domain-containing protein [Solirubrobacteraceae bacterium]
MRRRLALLTLLVPFAIPASAGAATGTYFPGDPVDGPSADVQSLGDLRVARDGTGAMTWVRKDGGVDHVFVSRLVAGAFLAPERVDGGLETPSSQPVVGVGDGGKVVVAYVNGGAVYTVNRGAGAQAYDAPQVISVPGINPSVATSINGTSYLAYTAAGDVHVARLDRKAATFAGVDGVLDIEQAADAGNGSGRPRVAVAADGVATVVWGESGGTYARRVFESRLSAAPQALADNSELPDIDTEDDSSYAWAVARRTADGGIVARRLVGSTFNDPVSIDAGTSSSEPNVDISGRGIGYAAMGAAGAPGAFGAVLKDDKFSPATLLGGGGGPSFPDAATAENGDGLIAFEQGDPNGRVVHARPFDYVATNRALTQPGPDVVLAKPELGQTDASRGLRAAADRAGDVAIAFIQGEGASRQLVVATFDRAPGTFLGYTTSKHFVKGPNPILKWGTSFELWGQLTYTVLIDGKPAGQTQATNLAVPTPVADGIHTWRVVATDRRGQSTATPVRNLRVDGVVPKASFRVSGARRRGGVVKMAVTASDASGTSARASGVKTVRVAFGDKTKAVLARRANHTYRRGGKYTVTVTVTDGAGNAATLTRRITIAA